MRGNGHVFISHAHDDNDRCAPLLAALDAWGVDYWFDTNRLEAGDDLSHAIQRAIAERDIFLRICTPAAQRSYWMRLEAGAFRGLQASEHSANGETYRVLINLILDPAYQPEPFDYAHLFIDTASKPRRIWLDDLRRALGIAPTATVPAALAPTPAPDGSITHTVDPHDPDAYPSIAAALAHARDGDRIVIHPGRYVEPLTLTRALTLTGEGPRERIIIEGDTATALRIDAPPTAPIHITNLTLRQTGGKILDCVAIASGHVELCDCDISAQTTGACVNITATCADPVLLRGNRIHDGNGWGIFLGGKDTVTLEDNEISGHTGSGLTLTGPDAYVIARRNHITRNTQHAIRISNGSGGIFADNDLRGNLLETWNIEKSSYGKVQRDHNQG
ncbi:MAG: hypothetical protein OJF49_002060 [Ktedonobacterales bacterium]|jgi:hypothetical protein|nr:MAG: hypothetical protein OJF49_002060 [Ktedonobacterales bacterium]